MSKKPAFVLHISLPPGYIDVNLSPDKREVVIVHEKCLIDDLREVLDDLFAPTRSTLDTSHAVQRDITDIFPASLQYASVHSMHLPADVGSGTCSSDRSSSSSCHGETQEDSTIDMDNCNAVSDLQQNALRKRPHSTQIVEQDTEVVHVDVPRKRVSTQWMMSMDDISINKTHSDANYDEKTTITTSDVKHLCDVTASMEEAASSLTRILSKEVGCFC